MRFLIVRHGDPDYQKDALTETGRKEALARHRTVSDALLRRYFPSLRRRNRAGVFRGVHFRREHNNRQFVLREFLPNHRQEKHPGVYHQRSPHSDREFHVKNDVVVFVPGKEVFGRVEIVGAVANVVLCIEQKGNRVADILVVIDDKRLIFSVHYLFPGRLIVTVTPLSQPSESNSRVPP